MAFEVFGPQGNVAECPVVYPLTDELRFLNNILVECDHILKDCVLSRAEAMKKKRHTWIDHSGRYTFGLLIVNAVRTFVFTMPRRVVLGNSVLNVEDFIRLGRPTRANSLEEPPCQ